MIKRFEDLSAEALGTLDEELGHIAETEQLSAEQSTRIASRAMEKAGFAERTTTAAAAVRPAIVHRKRTKLLGALIAAALSLTVLAVGVGGYLRYNKKSLEKTFGVLGTARLEEMNLAEPQRFTNGTVNATVDAVLCDGTRAIVLTTYSAADPAQKIDWDYQLHGYHEIGQEADTFRTAFPSTDRKQMIDGDCLVTTLIDIPAESAGGKLTIVYEKTETNFPSEEEIRNAGAAKRDLYESPEFVGSHVPYFCDLTDGLEIEIPLETNIPVLNMSSAGGDTLQLSGFEMIGECQSQLMADQGYFTIHYKDGNQARAWIPVAMENKGQYRVQIDGVKMKYDDPSTYIGFIDVSDVSAVEFAGTMYTRVG